MARNFYDPESCLWYRLNIDIDNSLRPEFLQWADYDSQTPGHRLYMLEPQKVFQDLWQQFTEQQLHLTFHTILVFICQEYKDDPVAHIDGPEYPLHTAINWCVTPDTQEMLWYNFPETVTRPFQATPLTWYNDGQGNFHADVASTEDRNEAVDLSQWYSSELEQIDHCLIGNSPTLVRISKPHMIATGQSQRISISARFNPLSRSWQDTVNHLNNFILPD